MLHGNEAINAPASQPSFCPRHHTHRLHRSIERSPNTGTLTTSIPEDLVHLIDLQFVTLREYLVQQNIILTSVGDAVVAKVLGAVAARIQHNQRSFRPHFLYASVDEACAAANDWLRLSDKLEAWLETTIDRLVESSIMVVTLKSDGASLVADLSGEAVQSAEHVQVLVMRKVQRTAVASDLFSRSWEDDWTHNEVMHELLEIFDLDLARVETFLVAEHLYQKALTSCCKALVCFYIRCLVQKADSVSLRRRNRERMGRAGERQAFSNADRALRRMQDDIALLRDFFRNKSVEKLTLSRILGDEMRVLELIHECLSAEDSDSLESFIVVIHKRTGADALVTRHFVSDLWLLVQRETGGGQLRQTISTLEPDLQMVSASIQERLASGPTDHSYVRVDLMLRAMYEDRIAQGLLPVCWTCLPKTGEEGSEVVGQKIRSFSRKLVELPRRLRKKQEDRVTI
jgi:hypothetical protein